MESMAPSKSPLLVLLESELIGRISRKLLWAALKINGRLGRRLEVEFLRLPYVRRLKMSLTSKRIKALVKYYRHLGSVLDEMPLQPLISVLIPVYKVPPHYLRECLQSVVHQVYKHWEICIVDDCSGDPLVVQLIEDFQRRYPGRIHFAINAKNSHISLTSNNCLKLAQGDYIALLDHDDRLYPNALGEMVRAINEHQGPDILYSDERTIDEWGNQRHEPFRKPGWSPFMHLCMNYTTHLSVYRTELIRQIGGFRQGFEGSQDHDLMLRAVENSKKAVVHVPFCLYQWRAHPQSTAMAMSSKPYAAIAGEKAVAEALQRRNRAAAVEYEPETHHYRLRFRLQEGQPLVSIIIPNKDCLALIATCLRSIYEKTLYKSFEVIVIDNGSIDPQVHALYDIYRREKANFAAEVSPHAFNFGKMVNRGVSLAKGSYVVLLNNDTELMDGEWLDEMLGLAQFPEIGAVGCKLLYPDRSVQHAGILLTGRTFAEHKGLGLPERYPLYCNIMNTIHECSGVSAACLMIRKDKYEEVGGFDATYIPNGYGDVEFCIKLSRKGYSHLFTPYARFIHYESHSRGDTLEYFEKFRLLRLYGAELINDPFLNPNLKCDKNYKIDPDFENLDLNAAEFAYFLAHRPEEWDAGMLKLKTSQK